MKIKSTINGLALTLSMLLPPVVDANAAKTSLVTVDKNGRAAGSIPFHNDRVTTISANGRFVVFESFGSDLVSNLPHLQADRNIYLRDLQTNKTKLIHRDSGDSKRPLISPDGRFVVFTTSFTRSNNEFVRQLFINDVKTGKNNLITTTGNGGGLAASAISANGRFILFESENSKLVKHDTNRTSDLFIYDIKAKTTKLVSANNTNTGTANKSSYPSARSSLSANGQTILFYSDASNLVANDTHDGLDGFVRDMKTQKTRLIKGADSGRGTLSADGRYVIFDTDNTGLVAQPDTNKSVDIFIHDLATHKTHLISTNKIGTASDTGPSRFFASSADSRFMLFHSAPNYFLGNYTYSAFLHDRVTHKTKYIMPSPNQDGSSDSVVLSSDGRYMVFSSAINNLVLHDTNNEPDVFVRDLKTGITTLISINKTGTASGKGESGEAVLSANGRTVIFKSDADDLVANDGNGTTDLFTYRLQ